METNIDVENQDIVMLQSSHRDRENAGIKYTQVIEMELKKKSIIKNKGVCDSNCLNEFVKCMLYIES